jgi:type I restriction enzyme S subunit
MSLPRYPRYKDSGVPWLGDVPEHWKMCALKRIASLQSGETINSDSIEESETYPVFGGNGLRGYTTTYTHDGKYALIGRQGALCGNVNYASGKFWASEHAVVVSPIKRVETVWLGELLRAMNLNQYSVSAAQPGLSVEVIRNLPIVLPPSLEQACIAAFLDREVGKIDALVEEQRRLTEPTYEKPRAKLAEFESKQQRGSTMSFKVSDKGGVSVYGLGRFPVTLPYEQWINLLDNAPELRNFLLANKSKLKMKE